MKIKSSINGLIMALAVVAIIVPSQAAWSCHKNYRHYKHHYVYYKCSGQGWHMVSKRCNIRPAANWNEYNSGVYTRPVVERNFLM